MENSPVELLMTLFNRSKKADGTDGMVASSHRDRVNAALSLLTDPPIATEDAIKLA